MYSMSSVTQGDQPPRSAVEPRVLLFVCHDYIKIYKDIKIFKDVKVS